VQGDGSVGVEPLEDVIGLAAEVGAPVAHARSDAYR
jgi:hypothetical protein